MDSCTEVQQLDCRAVGKLEFQFRGESQDAFGHRREDRIGGIRSAQIGETVLVQLVAEGDQFASDRIGVEDLGEHGEEFTSRDRSFDPEADGLEGIFELDGRLGGLPKSGQECRAAGES